MMKEKKYDLEERTFQFARDVRLFVKPVAKAGAEVIHSL
jgi:hypothetical protein